jgi:hypothetical protein
MSTVTLNGVVHGRTIELDRDPGLPEGQNVRVIVQPATGVEVVAPGEGLRRSAGTWNDDIEGLDRYLDWCREQRKHSRPEPQP